MHIFHGNRTRPAGQGDESTLSTFANGDEENLIAVSVISLIRDGSSHVVSRVPPSYVGTSLRDLGVCRAISDQIHPGQS